MNREDLYFKTPARVQDLLASAAGFGVDRKRYGGTYLEAELEYAARSNWSTDALTALARARRTKALALASVTHYYSRLFAQLGANWYELVDDQDFQKIPPTPKQHLRESPEDFAPRRQITTDIVGRTSGTTGSSLSVVRSQSAVAEQWAVWWRYRGWHGITRDEPCALFAGRRIMREDQGAPYWRRNISARELRFSIYHISPETASLYVDQLNKFRPRWIHGFPSAIANLASSILDQGLTISAPLRWVTLGAENVTALQMETIEAAFGVRPVQHYGLAEGVANFSTCIAGRLHVDEDFAGVDFVSATAGLTQILGTSFSNRARVLLRYDAGDLATLATSERHCGCGFGGRIISSLDGRSSETLELPDGRFIRPSYAFRADLGLSQAQIVQKLDGSIAVRYIRSGEWHSGSRQALEVALRELLGNTIVITFHEVIDLPRTPGGKVRLVVKE